RMTIDPWDTLLGRVAGLGERASTASRVKLEYRTCVLYGRLLQSQEQAIVEVGRVVQTIVVTQQGVEQATGTDEGGPVRIRAGQATGFQPQDDADVIEAEFREDVLKAEAAFDRLATASLVGVDDLDAIAGPAEGDRDVSEGILTCG